MGGAGVLEAGRRDATGEDFIFFPPHPEITIATTKGKASVRSGSRFMVRDYHTNLDV
jgi:hypothetical protein